MPLVQSPFLVQPGTQVALADYDTREDSGLSKKQGLEALAEASARLNELQHLLYATGKRSLLVILQGMDASGKDGVIKNVVGALNPQGCQVTSFKAPSAEELAHDFIWRVHKACPPRGMVGIMNRSHYEDVLVVRVEELVPEKVWRRRYQAICDFERILAESGTVIVKFYLHISKEEQRARLQDRLDSPDEHWKFNVSDLATRSKWDHYMAAYEEALSRCSTEYAPWYVIPADRKWHRNLVITQILVQTLESLDMQWPPLAPEAVGLVVE